MMSSRFLFTNGVVSRAPDTPPVSTFLESHPGAYTTTRSQNNGSSLLFWERHMKRLCDSIRILSNSNPQLFFDHQESAQSLPFPFLSLKCPESTVWEIVNDSMKKLWPIVLKERNSGEEFSVTTLVSGNLEKMNNEKWGSELVAEALDVYVYIGSYVPPKFGIAGNGANLAVVGRGRDVAKAKYSDWVRIRKHLEKLRPPSATELLLSNDGDHILEGSVSNFFVVCRKDKTDAMEKSLGVSHSLDCFEVQTASIGDGILPGIIRQLVREICLTKGISFREVAPSWSEHETWEEAFITNSLRLLQHVEAICIPSSWDSLESRSLEDITWDNKQFKEGPGLITTIIQRELTERTNTEGYLLSNFV